MRRPAVEGLGLFLEDSARAVEILRSLLPESGTVERLLIVRTVATVGLRDAAAHGVATRWLEILAADTTVLPEVRLAVLVHRVRCTPREIGDDVLLAAIDLLRKIVPDGDGRGKDPSCQAGAEQSDAAGPAPAPGVPPQIAAAFEDLERQGRVHAPTSSLLRAFHTLLDDRVPERTALLTEQLRSVDPAMRYDAIRMARDLIAQWRGDHTGLVVLLAECLLPEDAYTSAAAAQALGSLGPVSEPEALASCAGAARASHGPRVCASQDRLVRRAYQEAVRALARLGDLRALPSVLTALDEGTDAWRAVQVAGHLSEAAGDLTPRLSKLLAEVDFSDPSQSMSANALVSALGLQADPAAVPAITSTASAASPTTRNCWTPAAPWRPAPEHRSAAPLCPPAQPPGRAPRSGWVKGETEVNRAHEKDSPRAGEADLIIPTVGEQRGPRASGLECGRARGATSRKPKRRTGAVVRRDSREPPGLGVTIGIMTRTQGVVRPGRSTCEGRPARLRSP